MRRRLFLCAVDGVRPPILKKQADASVERAQMHPMPCRLRLSLIMLSKLI